METWFSGGWLALRRQLPSHHFPSSSNGARTCPFLVERRQLTEQAQYAAGGPVTYTPSGQRADMFQMNMDDYIGSSQTGWHRVATTLGATSSFVGWHKVAPTLLQLSFAQPGVNPTAAPATSNPSYVWPAIGISTLLALMGLILIARRSSRIREVLAGHGRAA